MSYETETTNVNRTLTAFFNDRTDAEDATQRLIDAGISRDSIRLVPGSDNGSSATSTDYGESRGFWDSLADFFFPDEDRSVYAEGLRRGGYLVTVTGISQAQHDVALDILDDEGSIDLDEYADNWRSEGWTGYDSSTDSSSDRLRSANLGSSDDTYVADTTTGMLGDTAAGLGTGLGTGTTGYDSTRSASTRTSATGNEEVIPVVEEELRIGKRDMNAGRVRVRSYVVETPVSEEVTLRDESVNVDRRAVDRPISATDDAFRDRTVEVEAHREEAVVSKDARVTEEVVVSKNAGQRTEKVEDTVRKTRVDIEGDDDKTRDSASLANRGLGDQSQNQRR